MKKVFPIIAFASLLVCIACGSGSGGSGGTPFTPQGGFSKTSLSGQYTYQFTGTTGSDLVEGGIFTADGNGNITGGTADFIQNGSTSLSNAFTGTYTVGNDGTGFMTITVSSQTLEYAFTIVNSSKVYLTQADGSANASGVAELQSASTMTAVPTGTFAFRLHNFDSLHGSTSTVGLFTLASGTLSSGAEDVLFLGGVTNSLTFTGGAFNPPTSGRGSGTLVDSTGTLSFEYYVIDGSHMNILPISAVGLGRAEMQTGGPFGASSLSGSYAFGSRGDTASNGTGGLQTAGVFTADGQGNISAGAQDLVQNGFSIANDSASGNYTMAASGRGDVNLISSALGAVHKIFWLVNPTRAFFLTDNSTETEDGTMDQQQSTTFTNATTNGQFGLSTSGFDLNQGLFIDRVGALNLDGNGNLTFDLAEIDTGTLQNEALTGTYSTASNGRVTATVNNISPNFIFYLVSGNDGYVIQNDSGVEEGGTMSKQ